MAEKVLEIAPQIAIASRERSYVILLSSCLTGTHLHFHVHERGSIKRPATTTIATTMTTTATVAAVL